MRKMRTSCCFRANRILCLLSPFLLGRGFSKQRRSMIKRRAVMLTVTRKRIGVLEV